MKKYKLIARRIYRVLIYSLAVVAIIAAVGISLLRILLSTVDAYHDDIEDLTSAYLDYRVEISDIDARIVGFTPSLIFEKVRLLDTTGSKVVIDFNSVRIGISPLQSWRSGQLIPAEVIIDGVELLVVRNEDNTIHIQDVDVSRFTKSDTITPGVELDENDLTKLFFSRTNLVLSNSRIIWKDLQRNTEARRFENVTLRMQNDGDHHKFHGSMMLPEHFGKRMDIAMNVIGNIRLPTTWKGRLYLNAGGLNLDKISEQWRAKDFRFNQGSIDLEVWSEIDNGRLKNLSGNVALYELIMEAPYFTEQYALEYMGGLFNIQFTGDDWELTVDQFKVINDAHVWPTTKFSVSHVTQNINDPALLSLTAEYFRLEDVSALLANTKFLPVEVYKKLIKTNPSGDITQLSLSTVLDDTASRIYNFQAHFKNLVLNAHGKQPGIAGLNGNVWANETHGRLEINSKYTSVNIPAIFRTPISLVHLDSILYWQKQSDTWDVWSNEIQANSPAINTVSKLLIEIPIKGSPYIDFQSRFSDGDASQVSDYIPVAIMQKDLIDWIDNSIKGGHVIEGGGIFRGRFADFPFIQQAGAFVVDFTAKDAEVNYMHGWPKISQAEFAGHFDSYGVQVALSKAKVFSSNINKSKIAINEFLNPMLTIEGSAYGDLNDVVRFLVESPISPESREFVEDSTISGTAKTNIYVQIPLSKEMKNVSSAGYQGKLNVHSGRIKLVEDRVDLRDITGGIDFSDEGEFDKNISATLFKEPVDIKLFSHKRGSKFVRTLVAHMPVKATNLYSMAGLKKNNRIKGKSEWQAVFSTSHENNGEVIPARLKLSSNLEGTEINMLPPLIKAKEQSEKIDLTFLFKNKSTEVNLDFSDRIASAFTFRENKLLSRFGIHFGKGSTQLPEKNEMSFSGSLKAFNLTEWLALIDEFTPQKTPGTFRNTPVIFNMQNLALKKLSPEEKKGKGITPKDIPYIKGTIKNLEYDGMQIGQLDTELIPGNRRVRIRKLDITSTDYQAKISGEWKQKLLGDNTNVIIGLKSSNTAKMLKTLGYAAVMKGGELAMQGNLSWKDKPQNVSLENIGGKLRLNIKKGALLNVDAGAGRLLGLFSLNELPRRLSLDFQDTFNEGFSFDEIDGDLRLKNGDITTDNLVAKSPVADLKVVGRTGFVARDFDQKITVIPAVSDTLPMAGGLLFGLEVGVAILLIDAIVGHEINKANLRQYHLTGTWENPVITDLSPKVEEDINAEDSF